MLGRGGGEHHLSKNVNLVKVWNKDDKVKAFMVGLLLQNSVICMCAYWLNQF